MVRNSLIVYGRKIEPWKLFCHSFRGFPPFSQHLSCWIFKIYGIFSHLIGRIISKQMLWLARTFFNLATYYSIQILTYLMLPSVLTWLLDVSWKGGVRNCDILVPVLKLFGREFFAWVVNKETLNEYKESRSKLSC